MRAPGGRSHRPRGTLAQQSLMAAHRLIDRVRCLFSDQGEALRKALTVVDAGMAEAEGFNPSGGGG